MKHPVLSIPVSNKVKGKNKHNNSKDLTHITLIKKTLPHLKNYGQWLRGWSAEQAFYSFWIDDSRNSFMHD